jgi:hypothetical protein
MCITEPEGDIMNTRLSSIYNRIQAGLAPALCSCLCFIVMAGSLEGTSGSLTARV